MFTVESFETFDGKTLRYGVLTRPERKKPARSPLLYVPGLGGSIKGALDFLNLLLEEYDPIYGPDLRGFGLNVKVPPHRTGTVSKDLQAFNERIKLKEQAPVGLVGISLGALYATQLAAQNQSIFHSMLLVSPAFAPSPQRFTLSYTLKNTLKALLQGPNAQTQMPYDYEALAHNLEASDEPHCQAEPLIVPTWFLLGVRLLSMSTMPKLKEIQLPSMVIIPEQDTVCDPKAMQKAYDTLPTSPNNICHTYADTYHDILMEREHGDIAQKYLNWSEPFSR